MPGQYNTNINPGTPPLLWSNLSEAFQKVNDNFTLISTVIQDGGLSLTDFTNFNTSIIPSSDNTIKLGDTNKNFKALHIADQSLVPGSENNGLWLGSAQITSSGGSITLPASTTLAGNLIIDPDKTYFKFIEIDHGNRVVASKFNDTLELLSGTAMQLVVDSGAESITFNNTGVTQLAGGTGISVNHATGSVTITNTGVTQLTAGEGISISGSTGNVTITNSGIRGINVVSGLSVSIDPNTRIATLNNSSPASGLFTFRTVSVPGQSLITSSSSTDTLTIYPGYGVKITTNAPQRAVTLSLDQKVDIIGSVFADNSSLLVDGVMGRLVGPLYADSFGTHTGAVSGNVTGNLTGNADTASLATNANNVATAVGSSTNTNYSIPYLTSTTGYQALKTDAGLLFNPSTNKVTADYFTANTNFLGDLIGNVRGDLKGTVVGDDSTVLVDGTSSKVVGPILSPSAYITGGTTITGMKRNYFKISGATGVVTHDYTKGDTFYHYNIVGNFNADFTNLALADGEYVRFTLILVQGATARFPTAVLLNGSNTGVTLSWKGGAAPSGNTTANKIDRITFEIVNNSGAYAVLGEQTTFG